MDKQKVPVTHDTVSSVLKPNNLANIDQDLDDSYESLIGKVKEEIDSSDGDTRDSKTKRKRDNTEPENSTETNKKKRKRDAVTYSMLVTNFPKTLTCHEINKFISLFLEGIPVKMEPEIEDNKQGLRLSFASVNQWLTAQEKLKDVQLGGTQLKVKIEAPPPESDSESQTTEIISEKPQDIWDSDDQGLYGLKPEFLARLNITPPIGKWVHIANFRCDKSELRDICELAGNVVVCSVVNNAYKYAKVMYSHPLEAVQAVSMLHDQVFYGQKLIVKMESSANIDVMLPKGLTNIGPGLGVDGTPVRDITREYEKFITGKSNNINVSLFRAGNIDGIILPETGKQAVSVDKIPVSVSEELVPKTSPNLVKPASPGVPPVMVRSAVMRPVRPAFGMNVQEPPRPYMNRNPVPSYRGPVPGPTPMMVRPDMQYPGYMPVAGRMPMQFVQSVPGPIPAPISMNAPVPGVSPNWLNPQNTGLVPQMLKCPDPTTLKITNLPPTTSFPSLCGKLSTLAQVTSLEFTTPGCAIVRFASPADAEKCFQKPIGIFSFPETRRLVKELIKHILNREL